MNHEIRNVISGNSRNSERNLIKTALFFIREGKRASIKTEKSEYFNKENEIKKLILFSDINKLWYNDKLDESTYIAEGAEQKVYLDYDGRNVIKINDTIFYESWKDYFISLLIHNYLFPATSYELIGFYKNEQTLCSVVRQPFVESTEPTDLIKVRDFLKANGFERKKNNDYYNNELGIILEDLHDENVLTNQGVLFVIDSVIYLKKDLN
ncbi:hypothetical protein GCM10011514_09120 [Emticicia aquatilis]|uniref:Uncharacterized protein n=1 Tax=Emticicia aquatilis TaxID=1537369 RepID=A0A916YJ77_9BACT|nr:hypothetical protein [Emticicia aquatilis]GGD47305.1 hypothetical protein GCM10011514_09120 [Emticicia aquatilis]